MTLAAWLYVYNLILESGRSQLTEVGNLPFPLSVLNFESKKTVVSKSPGQACSPELSLLAWAATAHTPSPHCLVSPGVAQGLGTHINNLSEIARVSLNLEQQPL